MTDFRDRSTGTLAEEVLQLIESLGAMAGAHAAGHAHGSAGGDAAAGERASWAEVGAAAECTVCPVCRLIAGIRQLRPEVLAHLVTAGEELLAAAQEFVAATPPADRSRSRSGARAPSEDSAPSSAPSSAPRPDGQPPVRPPGSRRPEPIELD